MRKFFYDTEFIERSPTLKIDFFPEVHKEKKYFPGTIDLISIGIVNEDGEEFHTTVQSFNIKEAVNDDWLRQNVLAHLPDKRHWIDRSTLKKRLLGYLQPSKADPIQLYSYYAAYDHVVLCHIFGKMIELPEGMPGYTIDLKQIAHHLGNPKLPKPQGIKHNALEDAKYHRDLYYFLKKYQEEHKNKFTI